MSTAHLKEYAADLLQVAGITINGQQPWDIQVHNDLFYQRVLRDGALGLGESYVEQWWDCPHLDQFFERLLRAKLEQRVRTNFRSVFKLFWLRFFNSQTKHRSLTVGKVHYDLGNELFQAMLDSRMNYTCGYWRDADNLEQAQQAKLELCCQKLQLKPGMRLLDIGCGFGALAKYAAENYGVSVVGVTISRQQQAYAQHQCARLPVDIRFQDYRDVDEKFDRIASLGMFEHVGHLNYRQYMRVARRCLADDGLFLLHTIGDNVSGVSTNEWVAKYIFPNGMLPSIAQIGTAIEDLFVMEDWHNFGVDYDPTLLAWQQNFTAHWSELKSHYDDRFYRIWSYYLLSSAGGFRARYIQLWQLVLSKEGLSAGYRAPR